ncbi:MAG: lactonase family protein [Planctomycetes bacterium]|nr:lactonase family protein [Planctomycetota bacterium]
MRTLLLAAALPLFAPMLGAQTFQLVLCDTPVGSGSFQPIERFVVGGTNGPLTAIPSIPAALTNDPTFPAFNQQYELFVSNRHAHNGQGSVSRFLFDPTFGVFNPNGTITGNSLSDCIQLAFNPLDGELFVGNWTNGRVSRFTFDAQGNAVANGTVTMPDASNILGVAIRAQDQQLLVSAYTFVRRFTRQANGSYVHAGNFTIPGGSLIHGMTFRNDELYVCDVATNAVHRFTFDASNQPVANGSVPTTSAIACAFSPDGEEMFVARHFAGGFQRLLRVPASNSWTPTTVYNGPQAGGIATTVHTFSAYGQGCPGTGNQAPTLQGYGLAFGGNTITLRTQLGLPNTFGTLVLAGAQGNVPLGGCTWWQSSVIGNTPLFLLDGAGRNDYAIFIPAGLLQIDLFFQSFVLDLGAPNGLFSTTAGLRASML